MVPFRRTSESKLYEVMRYAFLCSHKPTSASTVSNVGRQGLGVAFHLTDIWQLTCWPCQIMCSAIWQHAWFVLYQKKYHGKPKLSEALSMSHKPGPLKAWVSFQVCPLYPPFTRYARAIPLQESSAGIDRHSMTTPVRFSPGSTRGQHIRLRFDNRRSPSQGSLLVNKPGVPC